MKLQVTIDLADLLNTPVDEITNAQMTKVTDNLPRKPLSQATNADIPTGTIPGDAQLPDNAVVLPKDETMINPGQNSDPLKYEVQEGDTLKKISEKYGVSYGELSNHLLNTQGTTSIRAGDTIDIPRHFIDLSAA